MRKLTVQGRWLQWQDGTPFFYLGDTAWELFHRLNREEIEQYCAVRAAQGFNVVQAVALSEFAGVTVPNAYGRLPLLLTEGRPDPARPDDSGDDSYWRHVDFALDTAAAHGLVVGLLPTWGCYWNPAWSQAPVLFDEQNAYQYGRWLGARYRDRWNLLWMLGGDRPMETAEHRRIVDALARGLREGDDGAHLTTYHPHGCHQSTEYVADADWLDFHTAQTGHGVEQCYRSDAVMAAMAAASPKPYLDAEPRYEDHPACFDVSLGYTWDAADVRQNAYWNVLAGACGHTYGNHCVWSMNRKPEPYFPYVWSEALRHPGAEQMRHLRRLRESRDFASFRPCPGLAEGGGEGMGHMAAGQGAGYAYVYTPLGLPFSAELGRLDAGRAVRAAWYDPRTGAETPFAILPPDGRASFAPPSQGKGNDWVLILDVIH